MNLRFNRRRIQRDLHFLRTLVLEQLPEKSTTFFRTITQLALRAVTFLIPLLVTISLTIVVYMVGFEDVYQRHVNTYKAHRFIFILLSILFIVRLLILLPKVGRWRVRIFNFALLLLIFYLRDLAGEIPQLAVGSIELITKKLMLFAGVVILFFIEVSHILRFVYRRGVNPAMLFVASFVTFIVIGGFLLLLPNATTGSIHPLDALFMSASAVCVTGLTVLDTATGFTPTGQVIILILIQLGGLGIMTFAGMISFLVTGSVSIQSQVALQGMLSSNRMSNVISFISRIVLVTFTFEGIGAVMIYSTLSPDMFDSESRKIFFSIFHSVSAFCNAGFSTLSTGLYDVRLRHNYNLQWVIGLLVILGGMGFPILFNIFVSIRVKIKNAINRIFHLGEHENYTNVLDATSRLALATYFILLTLGFVAYFIFEFNHTLREHRSVMGIITTSFFGSVSPRTAGFGTVDFSLFSLPTIMIYLLLMLVGASPGSTGGGIKTTVAAVAFLNMKSVVLGHERTEAFRSEISTASVKRAFAIILLALMVLGLAVLLLSINDAEKGLLRLAFEAFSAFSTVGLSLGVTPDLSMFSKTVIILVMLIGRVGALTLLFAVVTRSAQKPYKYPTEEIMY